MEKHNIATHCLHWKKIGHETASQVSYFPTILQYAYSPDPRKPRSCPTTFNCKQNTSEQRILSEEQKGEEEKKKEM
jgi:hypothetical protein